MTKPVRIENVIVMNDGIAYRLNQGALKVNHDPKLIPTVKGPTVQNIKKEEKENN